MVIFIRITAANEKVLTKFGRKNSMSHQDLQILEYMAFFNRGHRFSLGMQAIV